MTGRLTFGAELRRRRQLAGLSLAQLATRVHYSKGQLSKVESGAQTAQPTLARLCDSALNANGELIALAITATHKDEPEDNDDPSTGFWNMSLDPDGTGHFAPMPGRAADPGVGLSLAPGRQSVDPAAAIALFETRFQATRQLGQLLSAALVLPPLIAETHTLRSLASNAPPESAAGLWRLVARYAEYAGWMSQETGNDQQALWWTRMAVRMAAYGGDESWRPFALMRHADVTLYADDGVGTIELARRAQADPAATARIRGLAVQREAQGYALIGDRESCLRALDRSATLLSEAAHLSAATPVLGVWTTPDTTMMARGWCLVDLGRPAEAAALLERGIAAFANGTSRARALWAMRTALAQAGADEIERACEIVEWLATDLHQIGSATMRHDVRLLHREFRRRAGQPRVRELMPVLADLLRDSSADRDPG
ncbi:MAG TPA: helix-turn-helix transcriptional regulator [Pseudonocardiaceae bacterium]